MKLLRNLYLILGILLFSNLLFSQNCIESNAQIDLAANNVSARLQITGDLWWDGDEAKYLVPFNPGSNENPSSLFAGGVWMAGLDLAGNLKLAAKTYGRSIGDTDFFAGPLSVDGTTTFDNCKNWDRFFKVTEEEIKTHLGFLEEDRNGTASYTDDKIPDGVKYWAAKGNPFFEPFYGFDLPDTPQGLADFWDENTDGIYNPLDGDYPALFQRGCSTPAIPTEMIFWIFNDAGGTHTETFSTPLEMEFQVTAFAFDNGDAFGNSTFYKYKIINRAQEDLTDAYFGLWTDPDLGCYTDDFVGCDTTRNMWYLYNEDAIDGETGCECRGGVVSYCEKTPMLGMDVVRGPLNSAGNELGMTSFTYYNSASVGAWPASTTDPQTASEYFNYLTGKWRDGSPQGENGYSFPSRPDCTDPSCLSMCTANFGPGDRRVIQSIGPMQFAPGEVNEIIFGAIWVPDVEHPCPNINKLLAADDFVQESFDNCLQFQNIPDAPIVGWRPGDQTLGGTIYNNPTSNNYGEDFQTVDIFAPDNLPVADRTYNFEGYKLFQVENRFVTIADLEDEDVSRLVYQTDKANGIGEIFNWTLDSDGNWSSEPKVNASNPDQGLNIRFELTDDAFTGEPLQNEEPYFYAVLAYAHNNYQTFDPQNSTGQKRPYLQGSYRIFEISASAIPDEDGAGTPKLITRIDGTGAGSRFLEMTPEMDEKILSGNFDGTIDYLGNRAPFEIRILDPDNLTKDSFELTLIDEDMNDDTLSTAIRWELTNLNTGEVFTSDTLEGKKRSYEEFAQYGFAIILKNGFNPGNNRDNMGDLQNGAIGAEKTYADPNGPNWYNKISDGARFYDFLQTDVFSVDANLDPRYTLSSLGDGSFVPYYLLDYRTRSIPYITPAWQDFGELVRNSSRIDDLPSIDLVMTSDKSKWTRSVVLEGTSTSLASFGFTTEGSSQYLDSRSAPSVGKDDINGDGLPDPDGDGDGMGWFPGYAIDVETGKRLNIMFAEASIYRCDEPFFNDFLNACDSGFFENDSPTGADMMWNPTSQLLINNVPQGTEGIWQAITGGMHFIYVLNEEYDSCNSVRSVVRPGINPLFKARVLSKIAWAGIPTINSGTSLNSYADGLIPNDLKFKIRVDHSFENYLGTGEKNGYPTYLFNLNDFDPIISNQSIVGSPLENIRLSPNPFSQKSGNELRIENLPRQSNIRIFDLSGKPVIDLGQAENDIMNWSPSMDLPEGIYFVEVRNEEFGKRVLKWILTK